MSKILDKRSATAKKPSTFGKWYEKNKGELSDKRKKRYQTDVEYREGIKNRQAIRRELSPRQSTAGSKIMKKIGKELREVFRIGTVAAMIGRSEQTIRIWEDKGVIPKPSVDSTHRYYTEHQIVLMKELAELVDQLRYEKVALELAFESKAKEIEQHWRG